MTGLQHVGQALESGTPRKAAADSSASSVSLESLAPIWSRIHARLKAEVGDAVYTNWLRNLELVSLEGSEVVVSAPSRVVRDWVRTNYADRLRALLHSDVPAIKSVEVMLRAAPQAAPSASASESATPQSQPLPVVNRFSEGPVVASARLDPREDLSTTLDPRFTFDSFVVGKPNELAYAAARRVADSDTVTFNPLFLYGGVGLGKTHLMHAIANHIRARNPDRKVIYLSAEKFMYLFIKSLRDKSTYALKDQFRSVDVLMIDDVQFIIGRDTTQEEFFHTFNALVDQNRQVIISADKSPSDLEGMEERLRSRLGWGLVADLHPTTYELRLGILQSKAERMGKSVPSKVLEFVAHKITSNVRELEGALNRICAHAELVGRPIGLETAQEVLQDLLRAHDRRITIDEIQRQVAAHYNIRLADMASARRSRAIARPRQIAMYLAKQLTPRSLPEIGRKFGGRDHTTVMHAVKVIDQMRTTDPTFAEDLDLLRRMLEA